MSSKSNPRVKKVSKRIKNMITFFIRDPVVSSAAIPCAAQKIDLKGFLLNQE